MTKDQAQAKKPKAKASTTHEVEVARSASHTHLQASKTKSSSSKLSKSQQEKNRDELEVEYKGSYHPESHHIESRIHPLFAQSESIPSSSHPIESHTPSLHTSIAEAKVPKPEKQNMETQYQGSYHPESHRPESQIHPLFAQPESTIAVPHIPPLAHLSQVEAQHQPEPQRQPTHRPTLAELAYQSARSRQPIRVQNLCAAICQILGVSPDIATLRILAMLHNGAIEPFDGYVLVGQDIRDLVEAFETAGGDRL